MQEIPIEGTSFLDEDAQSYPGIPVGAKYLRWKVELNNNQHPLLDKMPWKLVCHICKAPKKLPSAHWLHFSALQCRLECQSGYVAQRTPLITCVNGEYAKRCHYLQTLSLNSGRPRAILGIIGFDSPVISSPKSKGKTTWKNIASYKSLSILSPPCGRQALANNARLSSKTRKQGEGLRTIRFWWSKMFWMGQSCCFCSR